MNASFRFCWRALGLVSTVFVQHTVAAAPDAAPAVAPAAAAAPAPRFDVFEFEIEGNTVLPVTIVETTVTPFLGPDKTITDVEAARAALEKVYQETGYLSVFVELPEQRVSEGVVRLNVLEGKVSRLKVTGSRYFSQGYIRDRVTELGTGQVPNFNVVQAQLAEVNRTEERRVQPILRPGPTPGTVEAELKVTDQLPIEFSVEINNRQVQFTDPLRLQASLRYNNLFQADHSLSITAITAPQDPNQSKVLALSYAVPLPRGDAWLGFLVLSDSLVEPLGAANVVGKGVTLGVRRVWALPPTPTYTHSVSFGADYKDLKERINADGSSLSSPLRYLPFTLGYNASWVGEGSTTTLNLGGVFSLRGIARREIDCGGFGLEDQFSCKREEGDGSFAALTVDVAHTRQIGSWGSARWRLGAQAANQPLVGPEQFSIGGVDSVRGYLEAEAIGDLGVHFGIELAGPNWGNGPEGSWRHGLTELRGHLFTEAGLVRIKNPGAQENQASLAGAGVGLKMRWRKRVSAELDLAWPLKSTDATSKNDPRVHARVSLEF